MAWKLTCFQSQLSLPAGVLLSQYLLWCFAINLFQAFNTWNTHTILLKILFYFRIQLINNVTASDGQQRDSAIHIHVSILPQTPLPSRLPHHSKKSSLCYTVGPCWLSILNTVLCACRSQTPELSLSPILLHPLAPSNHKFILQVCASVSGL